MAVAMITKRDNKFYVTTRIMGQKHLLQICAKRITAAQIKQEVDSGRYVLPAYVPHRYTTRPKPIEKGFKEKIFAWLQNHQTMWTVAEIAKAFGCDSHVITGAIRKLLVQGRICRGSNRSTFTYGALGVLPVVEDIRQTIVDTLKQNPQGLFQRELTMCTRCHIPADFQKTLKTLLDSGIVKIVSARRMHTKTYAIGRKYQI